MALQALEIGNDDEVILPSYICSAVLNEVTRTGATPVLADVNLTDMNINFESVQEKISSKTKCIILAHLLGNIINVENGE